MPAEKKEIKEAKEEGINFLFQNNIVQINGNEKVEEIELIKTELIKKEDEERLIPVNIENSNYLLKTDYVIMALGGKVEEEIEKQELEKNRRGNILVNEKYQTSNKKIFAGGDVAGCKGTVAFAARSGRDAAINMVEYLKDNT